MSYNVNYKEYETRKLQKLLVKINQLIDFAKQYWLIPIRDLYNEELKGRGLN